MTSVARAIALILLPVAAAACTPPYQARSIWGVGYTDAAIDSSTMQVTYYGGNGTSRELIERYAIYRCAEVTVERGFDWFLLVSSSGEVGSSTQVKSSTSSSPAMGGTSTTSKTEVSTSKGGYIISRMIRMYHGARPADQPNAFTAREVLATMNVEKE
jgi:hypothetical protein